MNEHKLGVKLYFVEVKLYLWSCSFAFLFVKGDAFSDLF